MGKEQRTHPPLVTPKRGRGAMHELNKTKN
jgi:hypothetical protein